MEAVLAVTTASLSAFLFPLTFANVMNESTATVFNECGVQWLERSLTGPTAL
jgi:hypothetical protein